jgi:hypothetical protein
MQGILHQAIKSVVSKRYAYPDDFGDDCLDMG